MARTRRRMARPPRTRRRADWVFRNDLFDIAGAPIDQSGSYVPERSKVITPAAVNGTVFWLYDSHNLQNYVEFGGVGAQPIAKGMWRRSEGRQAKVLRVRGEMSFTPSVWALGSSYFLGVRFGIFQQNADSGLALLPVTYNIWGVAGFQDVDSPARYANDGAWQHQRMTIVRFNDNNATLNWTFNFAVNRSLRPNMGYGVYIETATGSVNLTVNSRLYSLVEGGNM